MVKIMMIAVLAQALREQKEVSCQQLRGRRVQSKVFPDPAQPRQFWPLALPLYFRQVTLNATLLAHVCSDVTSKLNGPVRYHELMVLFCVLHTLRSTVCCGPK